MVSKPKLPICPACEFDEPIWLHDDWFDCPSCDHHFNAPGYIQFLKQYQAYKRDEHQSNTMTNAMADRAEAAITIGCPHCHWEKDCIGLFPVGIDEDGNTVCQWQCIMCNEIIDEQWLEAEFQKRGFPLLTCPRCGKIYLMSWGHTDCPVAAAELNELIGLLSFATKPQGGGV